MVIEKNNVSFDVSESGVLVNMGCSLGTSITIPQKLPNGMVIKEIASYVCSGEFDRISISDGITICSGAFKNAKVNVVVWNDCPIIPDECFVGSSIKKIHNITNVKEVREKAFLSCGLHSIMWPQQCERIPDYCFADSKIEKISNIDHVRYVGECAFYRTCLKSITWPSKCKVIPLHCFACSSLGKINNIRHIAEIERSAFLESKLTSFTVPLGVRVLEESVFGGCGLLKSVSFHARFTTISDGCFEGCWTLTKVNHIDNVETIRSRAFKDCCNLTEIKWPSKCLDIPYGCFDGCLNLTHFDMPKNIRSIGKLAFRNTGIRELEWPDECKLIPYRCFQLSAIERLTNVSGVVQIDEEAFSYAKSLTHLDLTGCSIGCIGERAFESVKRESVLAPYYMDDAEFAQLFK